MGLSPAVRGHRIQGVALSHAEGAAARQPTGALLSRTWSYDPRQTIDIDGTAGVGLPIPQRRQYFRGAFRLYHKGKPFSDLYRRLGLRVRVPRQRRRGPPRLRLAPASPQVVAATPGTCGASQRSILERTGPLGVGILTTALLFGRREPHDRKASRVEFGRT